MTVAAKPKLLVMELWGVGDLAMATPFLQAAAKPFEVTLLAKPFAQEMQPRLWPGVKVIPFTAPWTTFHGKYHLWRWPWRQILSLRCRLAEMNFELGISPRPDPRDHTLMQFLAVKNRLGFPRLGSGVLLTTPLAGLPALAHRYDYWRSAGHALGLRLPARQELVFPATPSRSPWVAVHSGAAQPVRVWPLPHYLKLVQHLRSAGFEVRVICDPDQRAWWLKSGEAAVVTPAAIGELMDLLAGAAAFIGNDSGPGHLAAICGVPTFTLFGPQLPELFAPLHPQAEWIKGDDCIYKPCKDYCRHPSVLCMKDLTEDRTWPRIRAFVQTHLAGVGGHPR